MDAAKIENRTSPAVQPVSAGVDAWQARAERLMAEYLRAWGLRDPQTIATLSRQWAQRAVASLAPERRAVLGDIYRAALGQASLDMEHLLARVTESICTAASGADCCEGLVAIDLQAQVDQYPAALLLKDELPKALIEQLAGAARQVVPAESRLHMPTQSFGPPLAKRIKFQIRQTGRWLGHWLTRRRD